MYFTVTLILMNYNTFTKYKLIHDFIAKLFKFVMLQRFLTKNLKIYEKEEIINVP